MSSRAVASSHHEPCAGARTQTAEERTPGASARVCEMMNAKPNHYKQRNLTNYELALTLAVHSGFISKTGGDTR